jgi:hypothetical protein
VTDLQFKALQFLQGANARSCEEIFRKLWPTHRFLVLDSGSSKGGPSRIQFVVNNYMGKLRKRGWVFQKWDKFRKRLSQDFSLTTQGVLAFRKERDLRNVWLQEKLTK